MKLYTEEQVMKLTSAAYVAGQNHNTFIFGEEFKNITHIELPSDEEIEQGLFHQSNEYAYGYKDAFEIIRSQIKNKTHGTTNGS